MLEESIRSVAKIVGNGGNSSHGTLATIRVLQPASDGLVRSLKRRIPEEQLTQDGSEWVDESGERFEIVTTGR